MVEKEEVQEECLHYLLLAGMTDAPDRNAREGSALTRQLGMDVELPEVEKTNDILAPPKRSRAKPKTLPRSPSLYGGVDVGLVEVGCCGRLLWPHNKWPGSQLDLATALLARFLVSA